MNTVDVNNKESFIEFLQLLRLDLVNNPESWENIKLVDFLESFARYTEDIQGYYDNMELSIDSKEASWRVFADIFMGAKMYE